MSGNSALLINKEEGIKNIYIDLPKDNIPLILVGDVIEKLKQIPPHSISCIITSPPYWKMRNYEIEEQIGQEETFEEYVQRLVEVSKELFRVLKKDGSYFLNIGDTYIDQGLQMIPSRVALGMQNNGWLLRNIIVWYKPNHMPSPFKNRFTSTWEPIFFFTKNDWEKKCYFDIDKIRSLHLTKEERKDEKQLSFDNIKLRNHNNNYNGKFKGHEENKGASPGARQSLNGESYTLKRKYEVDQNEIADYLKKWRIKRNITVKEIDKRLGYAHTAGHWFRKDAGGSLPLPEDWKKLKEILKFDDRYDRQMTETHYILQTVSQHPNGKSPGDIWAMRTAKLTEEHFAVFPEELPRRIIQSCCPEDGIVLDPFAGSGTTGKVAKDLGRKSILIELQPKFINIIKKRCGNIKEA